MPLAAPVVDAGTGSAAFRQNGQAGWASSGSDRTSSVSMFWTSTLPAVSAGRTPVTSRNTSYASRLPIIAASGRPSGRGENPAPGTASVLHSWAADLGSTVVSRSAAQHQQPVWSSPMTGPTTARSPNTHAGSSRTPAGMPPPSSA